MKKILIDARPTNKPVSVIADAWVQSRSGGEESESMKRLTIDIPESLHRTIKRQCAERGNKMADEIRALLLQKYGQV